MNAGIQNEDLRRQSSGSIRRDAERARRRSSIRMNINLNDPTVPAPGEMQRSPSARSRAGAWPHSPHHERNPSLGELHQELEYEQEGQVNRLLSMIRQQQMQIQQLQAANPQSSTSAVDDSTPTSERSASIPQLPQITPQTTISPLPSSTPHSSNSPFALNPRSNMSRQSSIADRSRNSSHTGSPALRPSSGHGPTPHESYDILPTPALHTRDESAFYQAETQMLTRENQMLKLRIRELERQLSDANSTSSTTPHSPVLVSNLHNSPTTGRARQTSTDVSETAPPAGTTT
ncbi:hypothetical protein DM02DRAFT_540792 [Periconia macrospinosa]|uniref:Uncharacterized protein n=1 Tax=Periconia macrospinosa TaxID=97972 RepID=A0A2V1D6T4_9PLEO|nr:hypothetical protein DM02DRAFT_540792 [Periconia macrospinosa]